MSIEHTNEAVDTYFLTLNLEFSIFDTFEIVDENDGIKELKIKFKKDTVDNDKLDHLLYFRDEWIALKLYNVWMLSAEFDWARQNNSSMKKIGNYYLTHFRVRDTEAAMRVLMQFENYFLEIVRAVIL